MKKVLLILALTTMASLQGCATATQTYLPDGRMGFNLNCSGTAGNWGMCQEKAGEICGSKGYDIISHQGENLGNMTTYNSNVNTSAFANRYQASAMGFGQASMFSTPIVKRTMLIACHTPKISNNTNQTNDVLFSQ